MAKAQAALTTGIAEMVSFGVPFLANPDLPERYRRQQEQPEIFWHEPCTAPLNAPDPRRSTGKAHMATRTIRHLPSQRLLRHGLSITRRPEGPGL